MASAMYPVDAYTVHAAFVTAASTSFRCLSGALSPLAGPSMYHILELGWGNSLLGCIAIALIPLPVIFLKFSERIRQSKFMEMEI